MLGKFLDIKRLPMNALEFSHSRKCLVVQASKRSSRPIGEFFVCQVHPGLIFFSSNQLNELFSCSLSLVFQLRCSAKNLALNEGLGRESFIAIGSALHLSFCMLHVLHQLRIFANTVIDVFALSESVLCGERYAYPIMKTKYNQYNLITTSRAFLKWFSRRLVLIRGLFKLTPDFEFDNNN